MHSRCSVATIAILVSHLLQPAPALSQGTNSSVGSEALIAVGLPNPVVLYEFNEGNGNEVRDTSGVGQPINLTISSTNAVDWTDGGLLVHSPAVIISQSFPNELFAAIQRTNEFTIEAWIKPNDLGQDGPARVVSLSRDPSNRNFTLGQDSNRFDLRLRTSKRDRNGLPSTASTTGVVGLDLTHVVVTRDRGGQVRIFIDGNLDQESKVPGELSNWDLRTHLTIANEVGGGRPWLGSFHRVAIYDTALTDRQVQHQFTSGSEGTSRPTEEEIAAFRRRDHFVNQVAPVLAKHCLECHDAAISNGGLDLSTEKSWLLGGDQGAVFAEGNLDESLIWKMVSGDEMPLDRPPLRSDEKDVLRQWLADGASWAVARIDPAVYRHQGHQGEVWVQRLTVPEYIATVQVTLGIDMTAEAFRLLPADIRADGFSNTAYNMGVDLKHIDAYRQLAELAVTKLDVLAFAGKFNKSRKLSTDDTMREHVASMGKWVLRGPISESEVNDFCGIATTVASAGGNFEMAMRSILEAMLQSPRFIYRIENQNGRGGARTVGSYELANRLSYILWGSSPDEMLFQAASSGELRDREKLDAQIQRMLLSPRAIERSKQFLSDWLHLGRLNNLAPSEKEFPQWNKRLAGQMREESLGFFEEIVWRQGRPLSDLLNAQVTVLGPELAAFYGLDPMGKDAMIYDLSGVRSRGGLLTQPSVLTIGGDDASMVTRGLFVLDHLLRGVVNAPPPCVNTTPPPTAVGRTQRAIAEQRIADESCGVCHSRFEPLAFGLERFDGIGAYHEVDEHGNQLRDDGEILIPGESKPVKYRDSSELMDLLAKSERVKESLTWKLVQFSLGRPLVADDAESVSDLHRLALSEGGSYQALMRALIHSDLVQKVGTEKTP